MNSPGVFEGVVENAVLDWLGRVGWSIAHGPDIVPDAPGAVKAVA